jgi:hypothetical protein
MIHEGHEVNKGQFAMTRLIPNDDVGAVVGAAGEVHRELGSGFLDAVCREALEMALRERGIPFEAQKTFVR